MGPPWSTWIPLQILKCNLHPDRTAFFWSEKPICKNSSVLIHCIRAPYTSHCSSKVIACILFTEDLSTDGARPRCYSTKLRWTGPPPYSFTKCKSNVLLIMFLIQLLKTKNAQIYVHGLCGAIGVGAVRARSGAVGRGPGLSGAVLARSGTVRARSGLNPRAA